MFVVLSQLYHITAALPHFLSHTHRRRCRLRVSLSKRLIMYDNNLILIPEKGKRFCCFFLVLRQIFFLCGNSSKVFVLIWVGVVGCLRGRHLDLISRIAIYESSSQKSTSQTVLSNFTFLYPQINLRQALLISFNIGTRQIRDENDESLNLDQIWFFICLFYLVLWL